MKENSIKNFIQQGRNKYEKGTMHPDITKEPEFVIDTNAVNVWGLLSGREVQIHDIVHGDTTLKVINEVYKCRLRKKNPFHNEIYSLEFKFSPIMNESGYLNNKFIL
jgi:hypothetical protein